ncbi:apolipoprotein N-acyltransferase [Piscinibacter terrae]|uniref:Apolipoprotein N-acyltransferase n=1 Tax=Piscinibacter terrae TaxID=2496871 RepID=A0A3N7IW44_9BURK|nr:apolipoprotein N-acyltransferase [Albitalea terrae]RQP22992.1 apolipoprotein N-acyltransferase [Albitalea terrae]
MAGPRPPRLPLRPLTLPFDVIAAAAFGALQTLAFVYTEAWWLQLLGAAWLAWRGSVTSPGRAGLVGWLYGTAWMATGTFWLFISMNRYGGLPAWMAALAVLALAGFVSLYLAAAMAAFSRWRMGGPACNSLLFGAVWLLAELARGVIFTGFPWLASGYAHVDGPLAALAPFVGVYGLGAVGAALAAWTALAFTRTRLRYLGLAGAAAALVLCALVQPALTFTQPTGTLSVTLLQGDIPQDEKFATEHQGEALRWHVETMAAAQGDLVIAPETAVPFLPQQLPDGFWDQLRQRYATGPTHALFGVPLGDEQAGYTNSAVGLAPGAKEPYTYAKHHLVPFGEFIPKGFRWFTQMMNIPLGDFNRGALNAPSFVVKTERVAPNICYEDLFGEELAARFADPAGAPTMMANISNIGWFGETIAVEQHLNISRMRSLEFERAMLRATNTGATVIIDHRGHVTNSLKPFTRGVLEGPVQGRQGTTPFAWWASRWSLWPLALLGAAVTAGFIVLRRRL